MAVKEGRAWFQRLKASLSFWWDPVAGLEIPSLEEEGSFKPAELFPKLDLHFHQKIRQGVLGETPRLHRGQGLSFLQLRPYTPGDDIRKVDWNVFARTQSPYVKEHQEEQQQTIWLLLDASPSMWASRSLRWAITYLGYLAFWGLQQNLRLGASVVASPEHRFLLAPKTGKAHVYRILELFCRGAQLAGEANFSGGDLLTAHWEQLAEVVPKEATVFMVSDFLTHHPRWEVGLGTFAQHKKLQCVVLQAGASSFSPGVGWVPCVDSETGETLLMDFGDPQQVQQVQRALKGWEVDLQKRLEKFGEVQFVSPQETDPWEVFLRTGRGARALQRR